MYSIYRAVCCIPTIHRCDPCSRSLCTIESRDESCVSSVQPEFPNVIAVSTACCAVLAGSGGLANFAQRPELLRLGLATNCHQTAVQDGVTPSDRREFCSVASIDEAGVRKAAET